MTTKVPTRQITSGSATNGQVLTADGVGGASYTSLPAENVKAWGYFTVSGTTATKVSGFNFASVSRSSTGTYIVTLTSAMANTNYAVVALGGGRNLSTTITMGNTPTKTASTFSLVSYGSSTPAIVDVDYMYFVVLGE